MRETSLTAAPLSWTPDGLSEALEIAVDRIRRAKRVLVVAHERPDGDAVASTSAAAIICRALGARVQLFNVDEVPDALAFLPLVSEINAVAPTQRPDVTIALDFGWRSRAGAAFPEIGWGSHTIVIDHHPVLEEGFGDIHVHDPDAASTTELVYRLCVAAGVPLTPELATCLFAGLHTDTGSFRYACTSAGTFELGAQLLRTGIDTWSISSALYENESLARTRLLGYVLSTVCVSDCGRLSTFRLDNETLERFGATTEDASGLVKYARAIRGVEVAAQLTSGHDGLTHVSLRSRGAIDVSRVAVHFGGGGHRNAAAFTSGCEASEIERGLIEALTLVIDEAPTEAPE